MSFGSLRQQKTAAARYQCEAPECVTVEVAEACSKRVLQHRSRAKIQLVVDIHESVVRVLKKQKRTYIQQKTEHQDSPRHVEQRFELSGRPDFLHERDRKRNR